MQDNSKNNRRIAINTLLLYIRMLITMLVGLYTSRVVLKALGAEDFGIYNVVGGFVSMFAIVRSGLVSSTQRFVTYDLGTGDKAELNRTFSTIVLIYLFLCVIIVVFGELGGYWFIEFKMNIPTERLNAAKWVFQFSLVALIVTLLSSPYNSLIIAHERMKAFAYITIYEVFAKLGVAYIIFITTFDKLVIYAVLLCIVHITVPVLYALYCYRQFPDEIKIRWHLNWKKVCEIYAFAGWSMFGGFAHMGFTQGLNILLGMFFTPVVNAARGIAVQVQGVIMQFVANFQMAIDPQIIKSYARDDIDYMSRLISTSSRFSYFLLYFISLPIMLEVDTLLDWWLVDVPQYTSLFFRLIIVTTIYDAISNPYGKAIHATGRIRNYQIVCSTILIAIVPVAYIVLKMGGAPYSVFIVHVVLGFIAMVLRIYMADVIAKVPFRDFLVDTASKLILVTLISFILPFVIHLYFQEGAIRFLLVGFISVCSVGGCIYVFGITKSERELVLGKIRILTKNGI